MGYYIDFIFDNEQVNTYEDVLEAFLKQGARVMEEYYQDDSLPESDKRYYENHTPVLYPKISFPITVFKKEADSLKGNWAHTRLSWGLEPDEFQETMENIISLADAIGCRVYDGQIEEFISKDNLKKVIEAEASGSVCPVVSVMQINKYP